jgi:phytoene synthase
MIDGVLSDLPPRPIARFEDLYAYCYQVASVVGLTIVHVFGYSDPRALDLAEKCGVAFQLTNILRDVGEDARLGRNYLPEKDLAAHGQAAVLRDLGRRAAGYYAEARPLVGLVNRDSRAALWALIEIYRSLLDKIVASGFDVFRRRIRLSALRKSAIVARALLRIA